MSVVYVGICRYSIVRVSALVRIYIYIHTLEYHAGCTKNGTPKLKSREPYNYGALRYIASKIIKLIYKFLLLIVPRVGKSSRAQGARLQRYRIIYTKCQRAVALLI